MCNVLCALQVAHHAIRQRARQSIALIAIPAGPFCEVINMRDSVPLFAVALTVSETRLWTRSAEYLDQGMKWSTSAADSRIAAEQ
jgi:hypothetical protein